MKRVLFLFALICMVANVVFLSTTAFASEEINVQVSTTYSFTIDQSDQNGGYKSVYFTPQVDGCYEFLISSNNYSGTSMFIDLYDNYNIHLGGSNGLDRFVCYNLESNKKYCIYI